MNTPIARITSIALTGWLLAVSNPAQAQTRKPQEGTQEQRLEILRVVEQMPEFKGNIYTWLHTNIRYPKQALKDSVEGRVVMEFVVAEDGSVIRPKVVRSSGHAELDAEALRVISAMPAWKPGRQNGQPVNVYYTLPVTFSL